MHWPISRWEGGREGGKEGGLSTIKIAEEQGPDVYTISNGARGATSAAGTCYLSCRLLVDSWPLVRDYVPL